jgi:hypothetical protein
MKDCVERQALKAQLDSAYREWYAVKDIPGAGNEEAARKAQSKVHHIQRALGDHCAKHGCS